MKSFIPHFIPFAHYFMPDYANICQMGMVEKWLKTRKYKEIKHD